MNIELYIAVSALSSDEEEKVKDYFSELAKPVLVHCGAGEDRTARAIEILKTNATR